MSATTWLPGITSLLALVFAVALVDQWRDRRHAYQLVWAIGMAFYGIASGCEALAGAFGWSEALYRGWYLAGAVWTAGWLGLGTAFLLGRTRFGYAFAFSLFLAGLFTFLVRTKPEYANAGIVPLMYFLVALVLALAVAVETYFQDDKWPYLALAAVGGASVLSIGLMVTTSLPAPGYALDPVTRMPVATLFPPELRLLTPFLNVTGAFSLLLGAIFSTYVFMPKRRVLAYSLDPTQRGDEFLFNLLIAPFAIAVNLVLSLPGATRALARGEIHSRVQATLLLAIGAFVPSVTDSLNRFGDTSWFQLGKFLGVLFLFAGFLVSIEVFREIRVPFTRIVIHRRRERGHVESEDTSGGTATGGTATGGTATGGTAAGAGTARPA